MYPSRCIDKVGERGETRAVDPELRDALDRMAADVRSGDAETRAYVDERVGASVVEMRRYFDVVGESLRGEIRSLAELMAIWMETADGRSNEQAGRTDGLEGRVLRLEARVLNLEDERKLRRPRRPR